MTFPRSWRITNDKTFFLSDQFFKSTINDIKKNLSNLSFPIRASSWKCEKRVQSTVTIFRPRQSFFSMLLGSLGSRWFPLVVGHLNSLFYWYICRPTFIVQFKHLNLIYIIYSYTPTFIVFFLQLPRWLQSPATTRWVFMLSINTIISSMQCLVWLVCTHTWHLSILVHHRRLRQLWQTSAMSSSCQHHYIINAMCSSTLHILPLSHFFKLQVE